MSSMKQSEKMCPMTIFVMFIVGSIVVGLFSMWVDDNINSKTRSSMKVLSDSCTAKVDSLTIEDYRFLLQGQKEVIEMLKLRIKQLTKE